MLVLILFFIPVGLALIGFFVTRSAAWAGLLLVILSALQGFFNSYFWYALILGVVLALVFPKARRPWPNA